METLTIDVKTYVPRLMAVALKIASRPCEYVDVRDCTQHLAERDWCTHCALRRAAAEDLAGLQQPRALPEPARKPKRRRKLRRG